MQQNGRPTPPNPAELEAIFADPAQTKAYLANAHPKYRNFHSQPDAPAAVAAQSGPSSLDGLTTAQIIELGKSNAAGFMGAATWTIDRMTRAEHADLRQKDPKGYLALVREKFGNAASQSGVQEDGVNQFLTADEISALSASEARSYAIRNPKQFLHAIGAEIPQTKSKPLFETVDASSLWRPGQPMDLAKFQTKQEHEAARKHDPAAYLAAVQKQGRSI